MKTFAKIITYGALSILLGTGMLTSGCEKSPEQRREDIVNAAKSGDINSIEYALNDTNILNNRPGLGDTLKTMKDSIETSLKMNKKFEEDVKNQKGTYIEGKILDFTDEKFKNADFHYKLVGFEVYGGDIITLIDPYPNNLIRMKPVRIKQVVIPGGKIKESKLADLTYSLYYQCYGDIPGYGIILWNGMDYNYNK